MLTTIERIQMYLHTKHQQHEIVSLPPFQYYWRAENAGDLGHTAVPVQSQAAWETAVNTLIQQFERRQPPPRVQFLDTYAPNLPPVLMAKGFQLTHQLVVIACTPKSYRPAPTLPGLSTIILSREFSPEDVNQALQTRELGIDPFAARLTGTDALTFRQTLLTDRAFLLRFNREPAAAGMFAEIRQGVTELVGVATLPKFQQRGFAAYLTGYMTQVAFARQVDLVFMLLEKKEVVNVFKRVGYSACATLLTYELVS